MLVIFVSGVASIKFSMGSGEAFGKPVGVASHIDVEAYERGDLKSKRKELYLIAQAEERAEDIQEEHKNHEGDQAQQA